MEFLFALLILILFTVAVIIVFYIPYFIVFKLPIKNLLILFNWSLLDYKKKIPAYLNNNNYYLQLSDKEKKRFERRVFEFLVYKKFEHINENDIHATFQFKITDEIKIRIAATAVQLTFGHNSEYEYKIFNRIIISSKDYHSNYTQKIHKGETNPNAGYIALSWESFQEGAKFEHDTVHVGLHEFAHAAFSDEVSGNTNTEFTENISTWHEIVSDLSKEKETHDYLRRYAFANRMEFFAVTVEYFFEDPRTLRDKLPELYENMARLLNQDPLMPNFNLRR